MCSNYLNASGENPLRKGASSHEMIFLLSAGTGGMSGIFYLFTPGIFSLEMALSTVAQCFSS